MSNNFTAEFTADSYAAYTRSLALQNFRDEVNWLIDDLEEGLLPTLPVRIVLDENDLSGNYGIVLHEKGVEIAWRLHGGSYARRDVTIYLTDEARQMIAAYRAKVSA